MPRFITHNQPLAVAAALLLTSVLVLQLFYPTLSHAVASTTVATSTDEVVSQPEDQPGGETATTTEDAEATSSPDNADGQEGDENTGTTTITTGDATSGLTTETETNSNTVDATASSSAASTTPSSDATSTPTTTDSVASSSDTSASSSPDTASTTPEKLAATEETASTTTPTGSTTVTATNAATTTTNATSAATTGGNSGSGGSVTIDTGDAVAYADVLNVVNTNIVNSEGLVQFINGTLGYEDFDLRSDFELTYAQFDTALSTAACGDSSCGTTSTTLSSSNDATINNDVTVIANTGSNNATGSEAAVRTGNAYASANVVNVANTNITDSKYLLLVFNNFSDYTGDIVLPSSSFFNQYLAGGATNSTANVTATNDATVTNDVTTVADSGGNHAAGDGASVQTGNANASNNTFNLINQNLVHGNAFKMLVRVHGDWTGSVSGLPDGLTWQETPQGIEIISKNHPSASNTSEGSQATTTNTASINNAVSVYALTGNNRADGETGATIQTGNAYADSSIMNIANTNVIGSNWSNLIFTIYGNWSGNLNFGGNSDLWLGIQANADESPIMPGTSVAYTFTVFNQGNTTAKDVTLSSRFEEGALAFGSNNPYTQTGTNWQLGDIAAGDTKEVTYTATVSERLDDTSQSAVPLTAQVTSSNPDHNEKDNTDTVTIYVGQKKDNSPSTRPRFPAHFDISKSADRETTDSGDVVTYNIELFSRGGQLYDALLVDTLLNEDGEAVLTQSWPLDTIKNWERINIDYSVRFDESFAPGEYTNEAQLIGFHGSDREIYQRPYESEIASYTIRHELAPDGEVLGASTSQCTPYLSEYLRYGTANNEAAVEKLQVFLNIHLGSDLDVNGVFNAETEAAVRAFQELYQEHVLAPWGLEDGTGYVYYTTRQQINKIMCEGARNFSLSPEQQAEIRGARLR